MVHRRAWGPSHRVPNAGDDAMINTYGPVITIGTNAEVHQLSIGNAPGRRHTGGAGRLADELGYSRCYRWLIRHRQISSAANWANDGDVSSGGQRNGQPSSAARYDGHRRKISMLARAGREAAPSNSIIRRP
uniref:Virulence gene protein n=1 Tax=Agrobacterium tumefaciens TaxID=358 RepID=Q06181_AGRTU|nr:virulence gene [Agrobacterium tumefaciens]prf//1906218A virulent factor [Agrobacterium tumefaciens]